MSTQRDRLWTFIKLSSMAMKINCIKQIHKEQKNTDISYEYLVLLHSFKILRSMEATTVRTKEKQGSD